MLTPEIPEGFLPLTPAETSCVIANLFTQLEPPCPCRLPEPGEPVTFELRGTAYDGTAARVTIRGEEVRFYGAVETLARIRAGHCARPATLWAAEAPGNAGGNEGERAGTSQYTQEQQFEMLP